MFVAILVVFTIMVGVIVVVVVVAEYGDRILYMYW